MIYKSTITKKIIYTNIHTLGNQGKIMNKYKFKEILSNETKSVNHTFLIDDIVNNIIDEIKSCSDIDIILLSDTINLLERNKNDFSKEVLISQDVDDYFTYKKAFTDKEIEKFEVEIMGCLKEINAIDFAIQVVKIKKDNAIKNFKVDKAVIFNDNILKLQSDIEKIKERLKGIILKIQIIEDEFLDNFNRLVVDVKDKKITQKTTMESLIDNYTKEVVDEYKIDAIVSFIKKSFKNVDGGNIVDIVKSTPKLIEVFGENYEEIIERLSYVGANI